MLISPYQYRVKQLSSQQTNHLPNMYSSRNLISWRILRNLAGHLLLLLEIHGIMEIVLIEFSVSSYLVIVDNPHVYVRNGFLRFSSFMWHNCIDSDGMGGGK